MCSVWDTRRRVEEWRENLVAAVRMVEIHSIVDVVNNAGKLEPWVIRQMGGWGD